MDGFHPGEPNDLGLEVLEFGEVVHLLKPGAQFFGGIAQGLTEAFNAATKACSGAADPAVRAREMHRARSLLATLKGVVAGHPELVMVALPRVEEDLAWIERELHAAGHYNAPSWLRSALLWRASVLALAAGGA